MALNNHHTKEVCLKKKFYCIINYGHYKIHIDTITETYTIWAYKKEWIGGGEEWKGQG